MIYVNTHRSSYAAEYVLNQELMPHMSRNGRNELAVFKPLWNIPLHPQALSCNEVPGYAAGAIC